MLWFSGTAPHLIPMSHEFDGRVVLITGAARGLGRAAAERLLQQGAQVAVNVRDKSRATALAETLGSDAFAVPGDVSKSADVARIVKSTVDHFGRLDVLVNNAAIAPTTALEEIPESEWRETIEVNLTGAFLCIQAVVPAMKANQYGRIVNVSSKAGRNVSTLAGAHYTASKAGLLGLTRAAAKELGRYGITVNAVCPGLMDTELTHQTSTVRLESFSSGFPIPRLGTPIEFADLVCFLASDRAGYITGASIDINGGALMI